jgi:anti-anti-sigma factor
MRANALAQAGATMEIRTEHGAACTVLAVSGELTVETAAELKAELDQTFRSGGGAVLDLEAVASVDVAGLQLVLSAARTFAAAGVSFRLHPGDRVRQIAFDGGFELPEAAARETPAE